MKTEFEKLQLQLTLLLYPDLVKPEYNILEYKGSKFKKKDVEKYAQLLMSISFFLKKISRYPTYFEKFYVDEQIIPGYEALEHHVHAYLEDLETLKNKINNYISSLKNDIQQIAANKLEIRDSIEWLRDKVIENFENVSTHRGQHRHKGYKFLDSNIVNGEAALIILEHDEINKLLTDKGRAEVTKMATESFEKAKLYWQDNARGNYGQVTGLVEQVVKATRDTLLQFLDIKPFDPLTKEQTSGAAHIT